LAQKKVSQDFDSLVSVLPAGYQLQRRAGARGQAQQTEDAFAVHLRLVAADQHLGSEPPCHLGELRGRAQVEPEGMENLDVAAGTQGR
jgi:hypothetical protein